MIVQVPAAPSRHRVAVWRELRRFGAVPLGQGTWAAPDVPACREGAAKARDLARAGKGDLLLLTTGSSDDDAAKLRALFDAAREAEWLRRWSRTIRSRDVFGSARAAGADDELARCAAALDEFAAHVYREVHS